jgi:aryl-alcohol dehydrogenase-like predicted oxidoreductase
MGMGVTPWSPLRGGVLSGKYTRANREKVEPGRGDWVKIHLTDRNMDIVEGLIRVSKEVGATPAQVALAWVQSRPGVASTIIGARTMEQLEDNLKALEVKLAPEHVSALDEVSAIKPIFPNVFIPNARHNVQGGTTINGVASERWGMAPQNDKERW